WAPPGQYTVRLSVGGKTDTQPLTVKMDPRVTTSAADLARVAQLSREMYDGAVSTHHAYDQARRLVQALDSAGGQDAAAFRTQVVALAPAPQPRRRVFGRATASGPPTLNGASDAEMAAAMAMQEADVAATTREVAAC